ncbi:hypothetical protein SOPP22_08480 [Shewanella sp. OPT22]|nr:hypothetical protein SOPP22_08480 [Shewanella sp. OPT22]
MAAQVPSISTFSALPLTMTEQEHLPYLELSAPICRFPTAFVVSRGRSAQVLSFLHQNKDLEPYTFSINEGELEVCSVSNPCFDADVLDRGNTTSISDREYEGSTGFKSTKIPYNSYSVDLVIEHDLDTEKKKVNLCEYSGVCFSGGGAQAVGYCGVLNAYSPKALFLVDEVSGSSAGAAIAGAVAGGATPKQIEAWLIGCTQRGGSSKSMLYQNAEEALLLGLSEQKKQIVILLEKLGFPLKDADLRHLTFEQLELLKDYSISDYNEDKWGLDTAILMKKCEELKLGLNLGALGLKKLAIIGTCNKKHEICFSFCNSPKLAIVDAIVASASVPAIHKNTNIAANLIKRLPDELKGREQLLFSDGGITNNSPHAYLESEKVIVFAFSTAEDALTSKGLSLKQQVFKFFLRYDLYKAEKYNLASAAESDGRLLVFIDAGITSFNFSKAKNNFDEIVAKTHEGFSDFITRYGEHEAKAQCQASDSLKKRYRKVSEIGVDKSQRTRHLIQKDAFMESGEI